MFVQQVFALPNVTAAIATDIKPHKMSGIWNQALDLVLIDSSGLSWS